MQIVARNFAAIKTSPDPDAITS